MKGSRLTRSFLACLALVMLQGCLSGKVITGALRKTIKYDAVKRVDKAYLSEDDDLTICVTGIKAGERKVNRFAVDIAAAHLAAGGSDNATELQRDVVKNGCPEPSELEFGGPREIPTANVASKVQLPLNLIQSTSAPMAVYYLAGTYYVLTKRETVAGVDLQEPPGLKSGIPGYELKIFRVAPKQSRPQLYYFCFIPIALAGDVILITVEALKIAGQLLLKLFFTFGWLFL